MFLALAVAFILLALSNGFSSELGWKFGARTSSVGIPLPQLDDFGPLYCGGGVSADFGVWYAEVDDPQYYVS